MKSHEHRYVSGTIGYECGVCGLLKSTIEKTEPHGSLAFDKIANNIEKTRVIPSDAILHIGEKIKKDLLEIADRGEFEELRREIERYFSKKSDPEFEKFELALCKKCMQMTNHIGKKCQKCPMKGRMSQCAEGQCMHGDNVWNQAVKEPIENAIKEFEKGGWHITDIEKCRKFIKAVREYIK